MAVKQRAMVIFPSMHNNGLCVCGSLMAQTVQPSFASHMVCVGCATVDEIAWCHPGIVPELSDGSLNRENCCDVVCGWMCISCRQLQAQQLQYLSFCSHRIRILSDRNSHKFCIAHTAPSNLFHIFLFCRCVRFVARTVTRSQCKWQKMRNVKPRMKRNEEIIKSTSVTKCIHCWWTMHGIDVRRIAQAIDFIQIKLKAIPLPWRLRFPYNVIHY